MADLSRSGPVNPLALHPSPGETAPHSLGLGPDWVALQRRASVSLVPPGVTEERLCGNQLVNIHKLTLPAVRKGKDGRSRPTKYKARKQAKAEEAPPAIPVQLAVAQALPASTSPTSPTSS